MQILALPSVCSPVAYLSDTKLDLGPTASFDMWHGCTEGRSFLMMHAWLTDEYYRHANKNLREDFEE